MKSVFLILSLMLAGAVMAQDAQIHPVQSGQTPLSAEAFDAYTRGKTLFFGAGGTAYGVERYLKDRRVIWSFLDGKCQNGIWYEDSGQICFLYEDRTDPQCWTFYQGAGGLIARFENDPDATELYEAQDMGEEMLCYGPDVGV
ncbi:MAG: hypothetical protein ACWA5A_08205 [Marinibacterium sp.]